MNAIQGMMTTKTDPAASSAVASALSRHAAAKAANGSTGSEGSNGSKTGGSSEITSNDFLTLLVSELKNQDPTQPTDPNAYIQQLVGVNSLQQLIQINQGLTGFESKGNASTGSGTAG